MAIPGVELFLAFQNVNLLALMFDLEEDLELERPPFPEGVWMLWDEPVDPVHVAFETWQRGSAICPVAHGFPCMGKETRRRLPGSATGYTLEFPEEYGKPPIVFDGSVTPESEFVEWWDSRSRRGKRDEARALLLESLRAVWQERLEDADAVQKSLEPVVDNQSYRFAHGHAIKATAAFPGPVVPFP